MAQISQQPGKGERPMTPEQEHHLAQITAAFVTGCGTKYRKGQAEHGGNLWDVSMSALLDLAIEEAIDQCVYLITLRDKMRRSTMDVMAGVAVALNVEFPNGNPSQHGQQSTEPTAPVRSASLADIHNAAPSVSPSGSSASGAAGSGDTSRYLLCNGFKRGLVCVLERGHEGRCVNKVGYLFDPLASPRQG